MSFADVLANARELVTGVRAAVDVAAPVFRSRVLGPLANDNGAPGRWTQGPYLDNLNRVDPAYRQPAVSLSAPGIFRRVEAVPSGTNLTFQSFPGFVVGDSRFDVPRGAIWRLISVSCACVNDAGVANRSHQLVVLSDASSSLVSVAFMSNSDLVSTASQGTRHTWMAGVGPHAYWTSAATGAFVLGHGTIPERLILYEGARIGITGNGISVGDFITQVEFYVEEWSTVLR